MPYRDPEKQRLNWQRNNRRRQEAGYFRERMRRLKKEGRLKRYKPKPKQGSSLGWRGEQIALQRLPGSIKIGRPGDLSWRGKIVEVKTARKQTVQTTDYHTKQTKQCSTYRWKFLLTQLRKVDMFLIICKGLDDRVEYTFLIPDQDLEHKHLSITESHAARYARYLLTS